MDRDAIVGISRIEGDWVRWGEWYTDSIEAGDGDLIAELAEQLELDDPEVTRGLSDDQQLIITRLAQLGLRELAKRNHEKTNSESEPEGDCDGRQDRPSD
jgi:antitoxin component of MazEF toxin-antitoxin module